MTENEIASVIVDASYKVHTVLGPGLLESVYEAILAYELERRDMLVCRQMILPVVYESVVLDEADIVVGNKVIIELKSVEKIIPVHTKQLLT